MMINMRYEHHWSFYPLTYVVRPAPHPLLVELDGHVLDKEVWQATEWCEPWGDIQGPDAPKQPPLVGRNPAMTRFKALYDDSHLYIGAVLDPSPDFNTQAHFTQRNDPIFQKDSDFEVFVDVVGSTHFYKELEVNAINTIWNLMLDKPYLDGGREHSGRVAKPGQEQFYEVYHQKTATQVLTGKLNDPKGDGAKWSIEVALAYSDLYAATAKSPSPSDERTDEIPPEQFHHHPKPGTFWRVNFSRVELQGNVNWTWQPQVVWDAQSRKFQGKINMHLPDAWGYFYFASADETFDIHHHPVPRDPYWPVKLTAMHLYYAQHAFFKQHGHFASLLETLKDYVDLAIINPFSIKVDGDWHSPESKRFVVTVEEMTQHIEDKDDNNHGRRYCSVREDRFLQVGLVNEQADTTNN